MRVGGGRQPRVGANNVPNPVFEREESGRLPEGRVATERRRPGSPTSPCGQLPPVAARPPAPTVGNSAGGRKLPPPPLLRPGSSVHSSWMAGGTKVRAASRLAEGTDAGKLSSMSFSRARRATTMQGESGQAEVARAQWEGKIRSLVSQVPMFADTPPEQLDATIASAEVHEFPEGQDIVTQGEPSDCMYVLLTGRAEVYINDDEDAVYNYRAGGSFGELALLSALSGRRAPPRSATVRATRYARALWIGCEVLMEMDKVVDASKDAAGVSSSDDEEFTLSCEMEPASEGSGKTLEQRMKILRGHTRARAR